MAEHGTSVAATATADKVWKIWSDMSTWGRWNPNVWTMECQNGSASGTTGVMNTRAGQHHKMKLVNIVPGRSFALETSVLPGTMFRFNRRIELVSGKTTVGQWVEVKGPLGPLVGGILGPQVSREFANLLANLAREAESA
jgi:hypothetical protein